MWSFSNKQILNEKLMGYKHINKHFYFAVHVIVTAFKATANNPQHKFMYYLLEYYNEICKTKVHNYNILSYNVIKLYSHENENFFLNIH